MRTVAEIFIELERVGSHHVLDAGDHVSVSVFVQLGDGRVVQVGFLVGKDNNPVRPPRNKGRLEMVSFERILEVEPGSAIIHEDQVRDFRRMSVIPTFVGKGDCSGGQPGVVFDRGTAGANDVVMELN